MISEAPDRILGASAFSRIDLIGAQHQIRIQEEGCHTTYISTLSGSWCGRSCASDYRMLRLQFTRLLSIFLHETHGKIPRLLYVTLSHIRVHLRVINYSVQFSSPTRFQKCNIIDKAKSPKILCTMGFLESSFRIK